MHGREDTGSWLDFSIYCTCAVLDGIKSVCTFCNIKWQRKNKVLCWSCRNVCENEWWICQESETRQLTLQYKLRSPRRHYGFIRYSWNWWNHCWNCSSWNSISCFTRFPRRRRTWKSPTLNSAVKTETSELNLRIKRFLCLDRNKWDPLNKV